MYISQGKAGEGDNKIMGNNFLIDGSTIFVFCSVLAGRYIYMYVFMYI